MKVYILGIDHGIQLRDGISENSHTEFEKLLRQIVKDHAITFIGDETFADCKAIAKDVVGLNINWTPIEMPKEMRDKLGITEEQKNRPFETIESDGRLTRRYKRVPSDSIRESYMVDRILEKVGTSKNVLVLCGFSHSTELCKRFKELGHEVILDSLCKRPWYKHQDCP